MRRLVMMFLCISMAIGQLYAQNRTLSGRVTDEAGNPLGGATVSVVGGRGNATTSTAGDFSISVAANAREVEITYVGFTTRRVSITNQSSVTVKLTAGTQSLDEVIVTGYTARQRKDITSSIATVSGNAIASNPASSIDNMLQGKAAGVSIVRQNGRPGSNAYIRIRGESSISASNEPLFVVDGVAVPSDYYNALNPNDIEDIQILKDAASASLYGARGANGVIVVNTRKGKVSTSGITYRGQYGVNSKTPDKNFRLMDINEKLQYEYDNGISNEYIGNLIVQNGYANLAAVPKSVVEGWWAGLQSQNTDWQKVLLRDATFMSHEIAANGANDKGSYFFSLNKKNENGVGLGSYFNTYSGRLNADYKLRNWVTIGNNFSIAQQKYSALRDRYNAQNPFYAIYAYNAYEPVFNKDGSYNLTNTGFPIAEAIVNNPETQNFIKATNNTNLTFNITNGLKFKTTLGIYYIDYMREYQIKPNSVLDVYVGDPSARGSKTDNGSRNYNYTWTNVLSYDRTIGSKHRIGATAVTEQINDNFYAYSLSKKGFATGNLTTQDNGSTVTAASTSRSQYALASVLGEVHYNYETKYYLTGSFRRDGSSRFGANNRYGNFWSTSVGWDINKENFMQGITWLNLLKLRASTGTAGNYQIGNYASLQLFGYTSYNNLTAVVPSQVANPDLTWEKLRTSDAGVDFEVLKGRIKGTFDYYNKKTFSLLLAKPLPSTTGFTTITQNIGSMVNKGVELSLSTIPVQKRDFTWNLDLNIARNKNKITKLVNGKDIPNGLTRFVEGQPKDVFYLVRWAGVDPQTGASQYLDKDGNITTTYSAANAVVLNKTPDAKYFGSVNNTFTYKGISLSASIYARSGSYTYNYVQRDLNGGRSGVYRAQSADALDYWKKPGDIVSHPKFTEAVYTTDRFLQNSSYLRLRELTLGYDLPRNTATKLHLKALRFYVTGQNLWTKTDFQGDPEVGIGNTESGVTRVGQGALYSYPNIRTMVGGLNITF